MLYTTLAVRLGGGGTYSLQRLPIEPKQAYGWLYHPGEESHATKACGMVVGRLYSIACLVRGTNQVWGLGDGGVHLRGTAATRTRPSSAPPRPHKSPKTWHGMASLAGIQG